MTLPRVSGEFRVVADPELRFAPSGMAIATVRLVANSRKKNQAGEWEDDKVCWIRATAFKQAAENIAESIEKGMLVVAEGRLQTEEYETREGEKRTSVEMVLDSIGPSLAFATAKVTKVGRSQGGGGQAVERSSGGGQAAEDPWGTPAQGDEPPF